MIMEDRPVDSKTREKEKANQNNDHHQQGDIALPGQAGNNKGPPQPPLEKKRKATENNGNHVSTMMSRNDNDDASSSRNSGRPDNYAAVATPSVTPRNTDKTVRHSNIRADKQQQQQQVSTNRGSNYGQAIRVRSAGNFPEPGSTLGPFFCVGRLGKGTFCSIHKCLSLAAPSSTKDGQPTSSASPTPRLVAAKVELSDFVNSGVIEGESIMLEHLDKSLPPKTVPKYVGLYKSDEASAIVMELLPGEDMHYLREQAAAAATATGSSTSAAAAASSRRVSIADAVYLTAHVMLPLLREMHKAGVVHRDVKPSNCVRTRGRHFSLVDFGLSKSILVSKDSPHADTNHLWKPSSHSTITGTANSNNGNTNNNASNGPQQCLRKERDKADFRGTSMYASLRIHQGRDYSRRDDIWSLLYVFCDLISGGLPWMSHAAARDRDKCQELKEQICNHPEETARMLMGEDYHVSKYKRDLAIAKGTDDKNLPDLAQPLALSRDEKNVNLLKQAFQHVASLKYWDEPDYDLIQQCLLGFLEDPVDGDPIVKDISWETLDDVSTKSKQRQTPKWKEGVPKWEFEDSPDDIDPELWVEAEAERAKIQATSPPASMYGTSVDFSKLPVEWQYRIAQMNHTLENSGSTESHEVLNHFMQAALPLVYGTWDSRAYEFSQSNTANRGQYLREVYLRLINKCLNYAKKFNYFANRAWYYDTEGGSSSPDSAKRRKITWTMPGKNGNPTVSNSGMVAVSKVLFALEKARQAESRKAPAPL